MAIDLQNFVNEILRKETISVRVTTIDDLFTTTKQTTQALIPEWRSLTETQINNQIIHSFGDLEEATDWNDLHERVEAVAFLFSQKMLISEHRIPSDELYWSYDSPLNDKYRSAFTSERNANDIFSELLVDALTAIDNVYTGFETFSSLLSMSGVTSAEAQSALWALGTMTTFVTTSDEYDAGDIEEIPDVIQSEEMMRVVDEFTNNEDMTLKQAQESFFFSVYQEHTPT